MRPAVHPAMEQEIREVMARTTVLRAGAVLYPLMDDPVETRFGRVLAAQLASLGVRRHVWFSYDGRHPGPAGLLATRRPDPVDAPDEDEERLLALLFAGSGETRIAAPRSGPVWDEFARSVRKGAVADGLGRRRRDRYRFMRRLVRLQNAMRAYNRLHPRWEDDDALHRTGTPLAVLFNLDTGIPHWPSPPEEELFLPALLPVACAMGLAESA